MVKSTGMKSFQKAVYLLLLLLVLDITASGADAIQNEHAQAGTFGIWQAPESLQNRPEFQATNTATQVLQVAAGGAGGFGTAVEGTKAVVGFVATKGTDIARTAVLATTLTTTTFLNQCPKGCQEFQQVPVKVRDFTVYLDEILIQGSNYLNFLSKHLGQLNDASRGELGKKMFDAAKSVPGTLNDPKFQEALNSVIHYNK